MNELEMQEKVIKGLKCRIKCGCTNGWDVCDCECPYLGDSKGCAGADEDALALLEAQKQVAKVVKLKEIEYDRVYWMEIWNVVNPYPVAMQKREAGHLGNFYTDWQGDDFLESDYNVKWRLWTGKPTNEQMRK